MADLCKQCSIKLDGVDYGDLTNLCQDKTVVLGEGEGFPALCEGCGPTLVDWVGQCISTDCLEKHVPEKVSTTYTEVLP